MKLEVGKYYRARNGKKVGPLVVYEDSKFFTELSKSMLFYCHNGVRWSGDKNWDLISEWVDEMKITMDGKYAYRRDPYTQVRILCVDRDHPNLPVISLGGEVEYVSYHQAGGMAVDGWDFDLVPLQEKLPEVWVNVYPDGNVYLYTDEGLAKRSCGVSSLGRTIKYIPAPDQTS